MPAGGRLAVAGALLVPACTGDGDSLRPSRTTAPPVEAVPWSQALEVAAARRGEYRQVVVLSNDGAPVPSPRTTGLALSVLVSNPELADRLAAEQRTAEVRVLRGGGSVEITIDLTEVAADIAGATEPAEVDEGLAGSPLNIALIWTVTAPVGRCPRRPPPTWRRGTTAVRGRPHDLGARTGLQRDLRPVVGAAVRVEDPMLRHRRPVEPIGRRSEHVVQRPPAGQALGLAGGVKGRRSVRGRGRRAPRREPTCTPPRHCPLRPGSRRSRCSPRGAP